jgi:hypothetical protein
MIGAIVGLTLYDDVILLLFIDEDVEILGGGLINVLVKLQVGETCTSINGSPGPHFGRGLGFKSGLRGTILVLPPIVFLAVASGL